MEEEDVKTWIREGGREDVTGKVAKFNWQVKDYRFDKGGIIKAGSGSEQFARSKVGRTEAIVGIEDEELGAFEEEPGGEIVDAGEEK